MNDTSAGSPQVPGRRGGTRGAELAPRGPSRNVLLRDLLIFEFKLALDGFKDVFLAPFAVLAAILDITVAGPRFGHRFYSVVRAGERFDLWLNLYGPAAAADAEKDGLFGTAGSDRLIDHIQEIARDVTRRPRKEPGSQESATSPAKEPGRPPPDDPDRRPS